MFHQVSSGSLSLSTLALVIAAILWTGLVTWGYTIYAQSFGHSRVNPTDAHSVLRGLLGEYLGAAGYIGGASFALPS